MRLTLFISGALSAMFYVIFLLFKILHYPGSSLWIILSFGILALVFIPVMAAYLYKNTGRMSEKTEDT